MKDAQDGVLDWCSGCHNPTDKHTCARGEAERAQEEVSEVALLESLLNKRTKIIQRFMEAAKATDMETPDDVIARLAVSTPPVASARQIANAILMQIGCPKNSHEIFTVGGGTQEVTVTRVAEIIEPMLALSPAQAAPQDEGSKVMERIWERWHDEALGIEFPPTSHEEAFSIAAHHIDCAIAHALRTSVPAAQAVAGERPKIMSNGVELHPEDALCVLKGCKFMGYLSYGNIKFVDVPCPDCDLPKLMDFTTEFRCICGYSTNKEAKREAAAPAAAPPKHRFSSWRSATCSICGVHENYANQPCQTAAPISPPSASGQETFVTVLQSGAIVPTHFHKHPDDSFTECDCAAPSASQAEGGQGVEAQIGRLAKFILSLDCGFPTINQEYPNGMGACEAAEEYIKWLRGQLVNICLVGAKNA